MSAIDLTFIVLSIILLIYLVSVIVSKRRLPLVTELCYLAVYAISALFFFYPATWSWLDLNFGVQLVIDLSLFIAVFFLFGACVRLYQKLDGLRQEITNLTRIIALLDDKKASKKK